MSRGAKKERTLTKELGAFLTKTMIPDLRARAQAPAVDAVLRQRWEHERNEERTAEPYDDWVGQLIEQVGAAWILSCVFVRTLEDRDLVPRRRLAGEGAADSEHYFYELAPSLNARDYLLTVFRELSRFPGTEALLGPRGNAAWRLAPSGPVAQALLDLFRETKEDGTLRWTFAAPVAQGERVEPSVRPERSEPARASGVEGRRVESSTRFLGDLYQDLSESVRERYALLQTPDFVERFILGLTLDPAIQEFGLEEVRVIDPACGSGHFLLGAYDRLFETRLAAQPGVDRRAHALAALEQVFGADINPYAVAIARFRLTLAFLEKAGLTKLADAPRLPSNLVVADSLLYGARGANREFSELATSKREWGDALFTLEEPDRAVEVLSRGYHVVVGNPPYITCKDATLREKYRALYPRSAAGKYALAAPFTERFFQLGVRAGFIGLINANSFMKREFGKKLIESVLPTLDLTHVIDTSGAYIPGHGTPTVILAGRNRGPVSEGVRAVLGKRGEPETPVEPEQGKVWSSIAGHLGEVGFENEYVSVAEVDRATLEEHPWSLGGGGAAELKDVLESRCAKRLGGLAESIGFMAIVGEDDAYVVPSDVPARFGLPAREFGIGEFVRDWTVAADLRVVFPYDEEWVPVADNRTSRFLWPLRRLLAQRLMFGKTQLEAGLEWFEYRHVGREKLRTPLSIAFAEVATHNHFVLDRGGRVFKQTAPIVKLGEKASEDEHLALLGYLNSSTAGFWMKQVCMNKGAQGVNEGIKTEAWEQFTQRSGTALRKLPIPGDPFYRAVAIARALEGLANERGRASPLHVLIRWDEGGALALRDEFRECDRRDSALLARMCAIQEELDWLVYQTFGLLTPEDQQLLERARSEVWTDFANIGESPGAVERSGLFPGHRAFEVVLARDCLANDTSSTWFERNGYRSPSEIPATYSPACQRLIEARVTIIDRNPHVRLIEKPEFKRRWTARSYAEEARTAALSWLLDRAELLVKSGMSPASIRALSAELVRVAGVPEVLEYLFGEDASAGLLSLLEADAVPHLDAWRFSAVGLEKHGVWQRTWDLQRREDAGEDVGSFDPPPKYDQKDYRNPGYWRLRGKLDVPKERFISYPGAERDDDKSPLIGWAGWDHLQRAQALAAIYQERKDQDGWEKERLCPLLAGLLELVPWLKQWHNAPDADPAKDRAGDAFASFVEAEARSLGYTLDDLRAWRPEERRGRKSAARVMPFDSAAATGGGYAQGERDGADQPETAPKKPRKRKSKAKEAAE